MVVVVGLTLVDPLAELVVNDPGVIVMLVAPEVDQLSVLLAPDAILVGLAVNDLIGGRPDPVTVTFTVAVLEPAELVAVSK
ncbi:MAG TPA: hypothetical protein VKR52_05440 [Terracidiphilus sp.]|nr:hypothetical protein [Terracidiphilus sp.]